MVVISLPKIELSVITLTYDNRSDIFKQCIKHVLNNTKCSYEYIIIDNNASKETCALISRYTQLPSECQIQWIHLDKNYGTTIRNEGIKIAQGKYFAVIDDDALVYPNWFEEMKSYIDERTFAVGSEGANFTGDIDGWWFGPANLPSGSYCDFLTGYHCLYRNLRNQDGTPKHIMDSNLKSLRDESDIGFSAKLDGWKLKVCPKFCIHNSYRIWDPQFDSIDKDTSYFVNKWKPFIKSGQLRLEGLKNEKENRI
jgi:glycosyltransferase involved in cell wall biosynthesis